MTRSGVGESSPNARPRRGITVLRKVVPRCDASSGSHADITISKTRLRGRARSGFSAAQSPDRDPLGADEEVDAAGIQRRAVREADGAHAPLVVARRFEQDVRAAAAVLDGVAGQLGSQRADEGAAGDAPGAVEWLAALHRAALVLEDGAGERAVAIQASAGAERPQGVDAVSHEEHPVARACAQLGGRVALEHAHVIDAAPAQRDGGGQPGHATSEDANPEVHTSRSRPRVA